MPPKYVRTMPEWMKDVNRRLRRLEAARRGGTSSAAALAVRATTLTLAPGTVLHDNGDGTFTVVDQDSDTPEA